MDIIDLKVGDTVFVNFDKIYGQSGVYTVSKVGRDWVYVRDDRYRFPRKETFPTRLDGGQYSSPGGVYENEQQFLDITEVNGLFHKFKCRLPYRNSFGLTSDKIRQAAELMGITLD